MKLLAIDPGTEESGYVLVNEADYSPIQADKVENKTLLELIRKMEADDCIIEMPQFYGASMTAGQTIFETCVWVGKFMQAYRLVPQRMYRTTIKAILTGTTRATDAQVRRVLIDRFAKHDKRSGRGTKKNPDWFYGFKADMWQAYAVAVAYIDNMKESCNEQGWFY